MAEPSGAETRPQIRVTVKTPKDKEEIVICDQASVKEVVRLALRQEGGSCAPRGQRREGDLRDGLAPGTGPRPGRNPGPSRREQRVGGALPELVRGAWCGSGPMWPRYQGWGRGGGA